MSRALLAAVTLGTGVLALLSASTASAHIDLLEPEARAHGTAARDDTEIDDNSNLKSGPCGQMVSGRTERIATYAPGQKLTVRVREENAHTSYLSVRLNLDGERFPVRAQVPAAPDTQEQVLAAERALGEDGLLAVVRENNDTPGFVHEIEVTLPDATCSNCTLQVTQFMYDDPAAPYYFQCADLVIADAGAARDAGSVPATGGGGSLDPEPTGPAGGAATGSAGASAAPPGSEPASGTGTPVSTGSQSSAAPNGAPPSTTMTDDASDDSGCGLSPRRRGKTQDALPALLALGLVLARRSVSSNRKLVALSRKRGPPGDAQRRSGPSPPAIL
jgi:hypothetical protein